jgi:transposase
MKEAEAMSGAIEPIDWQESADELHERYKVERDLEARKRLGALWLVRRGENVSTAAQSMGIGRRTLTRWLSWYREGGLEEVLSRVPGHGALGNECRLSENQQQELVERAGRGEFRTYEEARRWVEQQWGVEYRYKGMYAVLARLGVRPKVPRPAAEKADPEMQEAWRGKRGTPRGTRSSGAGLGARGVALRRDALGVEGSDQEGFGPKRGEGGTAGATEV